MNNLDNDLPIASQTDVVKTAPQILDEHQISLLEEKLVVKRQKRKVGEVIVRKEIETRMIQLPIRREKLVIEKVGATNENEYVTEVDLGEGQINGVKFSELGDTQNLHLSQSGFVSIESAQKLLAAISDRFDSKVKVRVEIISDSSNSQTAYQEICDRY